MIIFKGTSSSETKEIENSCWKIIFTSMGKCPEYIFKLKKHITKHTIYI